MSRLFAGLAPGLTIAGLVAGGVIGLALTVWVVGIRGLLSDRAVLDRWINEVTACAAVGGRGVGRHPGAGRGSRAERRVARRDEADADAASARVSEIDAELREHAVATARAAALPGPAAASPCRRRSTPFGAELAGGPRELTAAF